MKNKVVIPNKIPHIIFVRGPLSSKKSSWFHSNFPFDWGQNILWVWKNASVSDHWKDWWERNQIYWKRLSNHPDAFWNPSHRTPEVWMVRVRRPEWFWGKSYVMNSSGRADHTILSDCSKCLQALYDNFPEGPLRMICWVIDDPFWNRISEKWVSFPLLKSCKFFVRPSTIDIVKQDDILKTIRINSSIEKTTNKVDPWDFNQWFQFGWSFSCLLLRSEDELEELSRARKLPTHLNWSEQSLLWLTS